MYNKLHEEYMYFKRKEMEQNRKKAEQEAFEIGFQRGIKIGIYLEKIATAKRLLAMKQDLNFIAKVTLLDIKTIESLKADKLDS